MQYVTDFKDFELIDMSNGEKLERWGKYYLVRPDPQIIWKEKSNPKMWNLMDARYIRSSTGGGHWEVIKKVPDSWKIEYNSLVFNIKPMGFKHTGLFPEQAVNWKYMMEKIAKRKKSGKDVRVLNLFAYTGGATLACLKAGASVCHVDSSKGMVAWAKENVISSGFKDKPVRFIVDDVIKFVTREIKRGNKYDAIVMDPPSYGRGAKGEVWSIEKDLSNLLELCIKLLSDNPLFVIINTYTGGLSGNIISNLLSIKISNERQELLSKGNISYDEIGIISKDTNMSLPCGITTKWEVKHE